MSIALLGTSLGIRPAHAQGLTGSFTLPFEARWGLATLAPGEYSFNLDRAHGSLQLYREARPVAMIYSQAANEKTSTRAVLMVVRGENSATIRELSLPDAGMVFYYAPHQAKRGSAQEERLTSQWIPLAVTAGGQ